MAKKFAIANKQSPPAYFTSRGYPNRLPLFEATKPQDAFQFLSFNEAHIFGLDNFEIDFEVIETI